MKAGRLLALALAAAALAGCGVTTRIQTTSSPPLAPQAYVDPLGVHVALTIAQVSAIESFVKRADTNATSDPGDYAAVANVEVGWAKGQRPGDVRVTYYYRCSAADFGYEVDVLRPNGSTRNRIGPTGSTDENGDQLCTSR